MKSAGFSGRVRRLIMRLPIFSTPSRFSKANHKIEIQNQTDKVIEIHIEMRPNRYLLKPNDLMAITAMLEGAPYSLGYCDGGLRVYAGWDSDPEVTINGTPVESDWETPNPD